MEAIAAFCGMTFTIAALLAVMAVLVSGCVRHEVTAPQIDRALTALQAQPCPKLELPPVPQDVVIDIKGDQVTANTGGEQLLRGYVSARSLLRGAP